MIKHFIGTCLLLCCGLGAAAQDSRFTISSEFNIPLGQLAWTYKPGIGALMNYSWVDNGNDVLRAYGLSVGYGVLPPLADTLYYTVDKGGIDGAGLGRAIYSKFQMIQLKATLDYSFPLGKKLALQAGGGVGIMYGIRDMTIEDDFGAEDGISEVVSWGMFTPTLGLEFILNDKVSVIPYFSYTAMVQLGNTNPNAIDYNADTGAFYHYCSAGVSFSFYF